MNLTKKMITSSLLTLSLTSAMATDIEFSSHPNKHHQYKTLVAGTTITLKYDTNRLAKCTAMGRVFQSYTKAYYRFDNGPIKSTDSFTELPNSTATIALPQISRTLEVWFRNYTLSSPNSPAVCDAYDSDFGSNYRFQIE